MHVLLSGSVTLSLILVLVVNSMIRVYQVIYSSAYISRLSRVFIATRYSYKLVGNLAMLTFNLGLVVFT